MIRRRARCAAVTRVLGLTVLLVAAAGCRSAHVPDTIVRLEHVDAVPLRAWDLDSAEVIEWQSDDPRFVQDRAMEASGLAASDRYLYVAAEKYATVLQVDTHEGHRVRVIQLDVPHGAELEGVAWHDGSLYLCDERHAAVYSTDIPDEENPPSEAVVRRLALFGLDVAGSKVGFEGLAVLDGGDRLYLLLERSGRPMRGCQSLIYPLRRTAQGLELDGLPLAVPLDDCNWRLTSLEPWGERILALRTRYPGERYQLAVIEPSVRTWSLLADLTDLTARMTGETWGNNLEGLAVAGDGSLYVVSDNAVTDEVDHVEPPPADRKTLLLRLPPVESR